MARENKDKKKKNELDELSNAIGNMFESLHVEQAGKSFEPPEEEEEKEIDLGPQEIKKHQVALKPREEIPAAPPSVVSGPDVGFEAPKSMKKEPPLPEEAPHAMDIAELLMTREKKALKDALKQAEEILPKPEGKKETVKKIEEVPLALPKKLEPPRQGTQPPPPSTTSRGGMAPLFAPQMDTIKPTIKSAEGIGAPKGEVGTPARPDESRPDRLKRIERPPTASQEELRKVRLRAELEELKREILAEQKPDQEIVTKTSTGLEFTEKFKDLGVRSEFKAKNFYERAMPVMLSAAALAILYFVYQLSPGIKEAVNALLVTILNYIGLGISSVGGGN